MLTTPEKAVLRQFMDTPGWDVLVKNFEEQLRMLLIEPVGGNDSFTTLRALHIRTGKIEILKNLLEDLEQLAHS